jgi:hypothetical protein
MEKYLSPEEVTNLIPGMSLTQLAQMRTRGTGPRFIKPSPRRVVYALTSIEEFLASKEQSRTGEPL